MLLLSRLLLASLHVGLSVSPGTVVVAQTPDVSVMEGETVHLACCWTGEFERMRVSWVKNQKQLKMENFGLKNHSPGYLRKETPDCFNLTFTNTTIEDSGRYICTLSVEIPLLTVIEGNGTVITVTGRDTTDDDTDPPMAVGSHKEEVLVYVLRCLSILSLFVTFFYLNKLGAKAQQHTPAAPGKKSTSAQRVEEDREEEDRDEREIEAE